MRLVLLAQSPGVVLKHEATEHPNDDGVRQPGGTLRRVPSVHAIAHREFSTSGNEEGIRSPEIRRSLAL